MKYAQAAVVAAPLRPGVDADYRALHWAIAKHAWRCGVGDRLAENESVRVIEMRDAGNAQWINVDVLDYSPCTVPAGREPHVIARGWLPTHGESGEPTVWFCSRGC